MKYRFVWLSALVAMLIASSGLASAQSLGAAARKEKQRREKNKQEGLTAREYSETIFDDEDESADDDEQPSDGSDEATSASTSESSPARGNRIDIKVAADESETAQETSQDRQRDEAQWRTRFRDARERVAYAREQKTILDGVHHVQGMKLLDDNGNVVVESLDDLRRMVAEATQEVSEAETALAALEEESRRAGIPPGWRR
jgi:hypothetical protein